MSKFWK